MSEIAIEHVAPKLVAAVTKPARLSTITAAIDQGFTAVASAIAQSDAEFAGPPLTIYYDQMCEDKDVPVGMAIPVTKPVDAGVVTSSELPGGTVAVVVHQGPYDQLSGVYGQLMVWLGEQGHRPVGAPREFYLNDPTEVPQSELLTRIEFPIEPAGS